MHDTNLLLPVSPLDFSSLFSFLDYDFPPDIIAHHLFFVIRTSPVYPFNIYYLFSFSFFFIVCFSVTLACLDIYCTSKEQFLVCWIDLCSALFLFISKLVFFWKSGLTTDLFLFSNLFFPQ